MRLSFPLISSFLTWNMFVLCIYETNHIIIKKYCEIYVCEVNFTVNFCWRALSLAESQIISCVICLNFHSFFIWCELSLSFDFFPDFKWWISSEQERKKKRNTMDMREWVRERRLLSFLKRISTHYTYC